MTNDQIRLKIAEVRGWNPDSEYHRECLPNYPSSHDAMAEALETLTINEQEGYVRHLSSAVYEGSLWNLLAATPRQQAEAFLKAKGLWEEGE